MDQSRRTAAQPVTVADLGAGADHTVDIARRSMEHDVPNRTRIDLLPIQEAVATASPSAWRDGLVVRPRARHPHRRPARRHLAVLATTAAPAIGEPVAVHLVAGVVALGGAWYSARPVVG